MDKIYSLGIDVGTRAAGYALVGSGESDRLTILSCEGVKFKATDHVNVRIAQLADGARKRIVCNKGRGRLLVMVERPFLHPRNRSASIPLAMALGACLQVCHDEQVDFIDMTASELRRKAFYGKTYSHFALGKKTQAITMARRMCESWEGSEHLATASDDAVDALIAAIGGAHLLRQKLVAVAE